jgi:hypothetical protein
MRREALKLAIIAVAIRLVIAPFFMHTWDVTTILISTDQFLKGINPYQYVLQQLEALYDATGLHLPYYGFLYLPHVLLVYTPFYGAYLALFRDAPLVGGHGDIYTGLKLIYPQLYYALLLIKLPVIFADGAVTYLLYRKSVRAAKIYAFSPYVIVITSMWGNFDPLIGLLLLLSSLTFERHRMLSGLLYGFSCMKFYTIVCLGAFLPRLIRQPKEMLRFLAGCVISQVPTLWFLARDPNAFLSALILQATRPINGVNIYYSMAAVRGLEQVQFLTKIITLIFVGAVIAVSIHYARRKVDLNEAITGLMLTYVVFAPVTNEQLLAAIIPVGLLSKNFSHKLTVFPLLYIAFNSTYHYFAIPIFYSSEALRATWEGLNALWGLWVKDYQMQLRYLLGAGLGFSSFWLLTTSLGAPRVTVKLSLPEWRVKR